MSLQTGHPLTRTLTHVFGPITGAPGSSGVFASFGNPFGQNVIVTRAVLHIVTQSGGASTLDIGIAADGTTSNDNLIDGLSGAAAGLFGNTSNAGTNGRHQAAWNANQFLNVAEASGDVNALVANLYIEAIPVAP